MNWKLTNFLLISALALTPFSAHAQKDASLWLTNPDKSALFQLQTAPNSVHNICCDGKYYDRRRRQEDVSIDRRIWFCTDRRQRSTDCAYGPRQTGSAPSGAVYDR